MRLAVSFTNLGPYHLARLRALAVALHRDGGELVVLETAGSERRYPWLTSRSQEPFTWTTLFPGRALESIPASACGQAMKEALARHLPDAVAICGYVRPESLSALDWSRRHRRPAILMSESQKIDRPRVWWKETVKRRRVQKFDSALVGGPSHRDYLTELGMPLDRIALGYNAVDNLHYARSSERARGDLLARVNRPSRPYFLCVARFVPEKNLATLIHAYARYREASDPLSAWDLVLCGSGPDEAKIEHEIRSLDLASCIHRPGFLQADELAGWYAFASGFVLPSLSEPWGLVVNEAAACGLPLLVSERAGCAGTLVPDPPGTTGLRFDPSDVEALAASLAWLSILNPEDRLRMGRCAAECRCPVGPRPVRPGHDRRNLARQARPAPCQVVRPERSGSRDEHVTRSHVSGIANARGPRPCLLAPHLQRARPRARRGHGAEHPGNHRLARFVHQGVAIVTPTPSNLGQSPVPGSLRLIGPEPDLTRFVRSPRSSTSTASGRPIPGGAPGRQTLSRAISDRRARHGRTLGLAA